jgi:predicted chitinase
MIDLYFHDGIDLNDYAFVFGKNGGAVKINNNKKMSYVETLNETQKDNVRFILAAMIEKHINNTYTKEAILSIISKESNFLPKNELPYNTTSNERIRLIFGSRVRSLSEDELSNLKQHPEQFFDTIYGGRYGNAMDEGYKYRGRGFNQLTFKNNYKKIAKDIGVDIVSDPNLMNNVEVSSKAVVQYFVNAFKTISKELLSHYNTDGINGFKNLKDATSCIYHANAGWGKTVAAIQSDPTGGLKKSLNRCYEFANLIDKL